MAWDFFYHKKNIGLDIGLDLALVVCILYWIKATRINLNGKKVKKTQLLIIFLCTLCFC